MSNIKKDLAYECYGTDEYLCSTGIYIHSDYRGYELSRCMLNIRYNLC